MTEESKDLLRVAAENLITAYETLEPIPPLRDQIPDMTVTDAYRVQRLQDEWMTRGRGPLVGHKIGLTSKAMQEQLNVDSPDFGVFTRDMLHHDNAHIPASGFISPKVEPEFAFVLDKDLTGPNVTIDDARAAIGTVHAAIEIIDSRIQNWDITLVDTIADNASCGAVAMSKQPLDLSPYRLATITCSLSIDGTVVGQGTGADVLGDPVAPVAWLANVLTENGSGLSAGDIVLPGSFCAAAPVTAGTTATADYGGFGALTISF